MYDSYYIIQYDYYIYIFVYSVYLYLRCNDGFFGSSVEKPLTDKPKRTDKRSASKQRHSGKRPNVLLRLWQLQIYPCYSVQQLFMLTTFTPCICDTTNFGKVVEVLHSCRSSMIAIRQMMFQKLSSEVLKRVNGTWVIPYCGDHMVSQFQ